MFCSVVLLALFATVQGRAVNISNTWVLPEEGFPVFYRYFRDRISWYEADAVCQFHHANLVTVDTTAQYDAVRAYLKELDISSAVWVGLIRSNPDGDFTWTDYRGLSGDGYWSSAPDARSAPLCAAADPAADYRWEARACGGPSVASFICELPVPQWALGNEGCMVRALPALTALYLPESAAVQLTADCGMAGVKKVQCTGNVKRENLLKELSCNEENESSSVSSVTASEMTWPVTTEISTSDETFTEQDTVNEITTENTLSTKYKEITSEPLTTNKPFPSVNHDIVFNNARIIPKTIDYKMSHILQDKDINLMSNNLQSNDIPQIAGNDNFLFDEQNEKLEDEKNLKHKMLHDELARLGNFETIFSQPADHFVPPLVMAKSKMNDDMMVMSLKEKHAQQLSEQKIAKYNLVNKQNENLPSEIEEKNILTTTVNSKFSTDLPFEMKMQATKSKDYLKKETLKSTLPKKYGDKYLKPKTSKQFDDKIAKLERTMTNVIQTSTPNNTAQTPISVDNVSEVQNDLTMDLTVILKEPISETVKPTISEIKTNPTSLAENVQTTPQPDTAQSSTVTNKDHLIETQSTTLNDLPTTDEVIKITILNDNVHVHGSSSESPLRVIEITTRLPLQHESENTHVPEMLTTIQNIVLPASRASYEKQSLISSTLSPAGSNTFDVKNTNVMTTNIPAVVTEEKITTQEIDIANGTTIKLTTQNPLTSNVQPVQVNDISTLFPKDLSTENVLLNSTNLPEHDIKYDSTDSIDYLNSPLLSAANEPLHRPNRSRRPQPPNRVTKFNPFRILG